MALPTPVLDDRTFQDIVDEAKRLIPTLCPEWTDHNVSDPGVTLIELFAWMTEMMLYRINRIPEKSHIALMELMGVKLRPASAARTNLTFWLTTPASVALTIPADTEVTTVQTTSENAIIFSTDHDLTISPVNPTALVMSLDGGLSHIDQTAHLDRETEIFYPFATQEGTPTAIQGAYFAFCSAADLSCHVLEIEVSGARGALGVDPKHPPLRWQAWCNTEWADAQLDFDSTGALTTDGLMRVILPDGMSRMELVSAKAVSTPAVLPIFQDDQPDEAPHSDQPTFGFWVRCVNQAQGLKKEVKPYQESPRISTLRIGAIGGTVSATHATTVSAELLGRSNGKPGQTFQLLYRPVLPPQRANERLEIQRPMVTRAASQVGLRGTNGNSSHTSPAQPVGGPSVGTLAEAQWEPWLLREHFGESRPADRHYTLDPISGTISFGPAVREVNGEYQRYGMIPPEGSQIRMRSYRFGGGTLGNVAKGTLAVLRSTLAYVDRVENREAATGGTDAETIDQARVRAGREFRTRDRAVTAEDFELLALAADQSVARAKCVVPGATETGIVRVLLVPHAEPGAIDGALSLEQLHISERTVQTVRAYLDDRRLLTTQLVVEQPRYVQVSVQATLAVQQGRIITEAHKADLNRRAERALNAFLSPLTGGPDGTGWPFGRTLFRSEIFGVLQQVDGVVYVTDALKIQLTPADGTQFSAAATAQRFDLASDQLVCAAVHKLEIVPIGDDRG